MKRTFCIVMILIAFAGCKDIVNSDKNINSKPVNTTGRYSYTKADQTHDVLWPLKLNNYWVYNIYAIDSLGNTITTLKDTLKVDSVITYGNDAWYILFDYRGQPISPSQDPHIISNTDIGVWTYNGETEGVMDYLIAKYPVNDGEIFSYTTDITIVVNKAPNSYISYKSKATRKVTAIFNQKINLVAGSFNCIKYTESFENIEKISDSFMIPCTDYYFAENIGLIRKDILWSEYKNNQFVKKTTAVRYELLGYKLN